MKRRSPAPDQIPRAKAMLSESALRGNYRALAKLTPGLGILPMIKANAYGHGAVWAADVLKSMPGLRGFGVATLAEAIELRRAVKLQAHLPILVFSGVSPLNEERARLFMKEGLTPVISTHEDWRLFSHGPGFGKLRYELKFNTGMNRLGLPLALADELAGMFAKHPKKRPVGVCSHLASSEDPTSDLSRRQLEGFLWLKGTLGGALSGFTAFHLGNSGAMWNEAAWRLRELTDFARPGLSLYGVPPWSGAPERGLELVMSVEARVIEVRSIGPGEAVGYGGTFRPEAGPARVAILSAGYADGIHRALSNEGAALVNPGARSESLCRFAGVVSMDLSAVEVPTGVQVRAGDYVRVLGKGIEPWAQSRLAGTVPYELLTSVSGRVQRIYA